MVFDALRNDTRLKHVQKNLRFTTNQLDKTLLPLQYSYDTSNRLTSELVEILDFFHRVDWNRTDYDSGTGSFPIFRLTFSK